MALGQGQPELAQYWLSSLSDDLEEALLPRLMARLGTGRVSEALSLLQAADSSGLGLPVFDDVRQAFDPTQTDSAYSDYALYLRLAFGQLPLAEWEQFSFTNEGYLAAAIQERLSHALREGNAELAEELMALFDSRFEQRRTELNQLYFRCLWTAGRQEKVLAAAQNGQQLGSDAAFYQAAVLGTVSPELLKRAEANALDEWLVDEVSSLLRQEGRQEEAYGLLLESLEVHHRSRVLSEAYVLICADMGLESYAFRALDDYARWAQAARLSQVRQTLEQRLAAEPAAW